MFWFCYGPYPQHCTELVLSRHHPLAVDRTGFVTTLTHNTVQNWFCHGPDPTTLYRTGFVTALTHNTVQNWLCHGPDPQHCTELLVYRSHLLATQKCSCFLHLHPLSVCRTIFISVPHTPCSKQNYFSFCPTTDFFSSCLFVRWLLNVPAAIPP